MGEQVVGELSDREHVDQVEEQLDVGYPGPGVAGQIVRCSPPAHGSCGRHWLGSAPRTGRDDSTPRTDRDDITDPADIAESSDRTENADPTLNADAKDPTDPMDKAEPTDPMDRTDPRDPIDRRESCDHRDHFDDGFIGAIFHAGGSSAHRGHPYDTDVPGRMA